MSNTILIKHGNGVPNGKLLPYELGYCDDNSLLYIGGKKTSDGNLGDAILINPSLENARGILGIEHGGTGAINVIDARNNLGINDAANITTGTLDINRLPTISIEKGGTGAINVIDARNNLIGIGYNPDSVIGENDLPANWKALGMGVAYISDSTLTSINGQPTAYGYIFNGVYGNLVVQTWFSYGSDTFIFKRSGAVSDNTWGNWVEGFSRYDVIPVNNGGTGATNVATAAANLKVLPLTGGTLTGNITIQKATVASNTYDDGNPSITFKNAGGSQAVQLVYTDYNTIYDPASLTLTGDQTGIAFIAPYVKTTLISNAYGTATPSGSGKTGQVYFQTIS